MKGIEAVASAVELDGGYAGIPGYKNGYVVVNGTTIPLRADKPLILHNTGVINLAIPSQANLAPIYLPFPALIIGLKAIVTTSFSGSPKFRIGTQSSATALMNDQALTGNPAAGDVIDLIPKMANYNVTTWNGFSTGGPDIKVVFGNDATTAAAGAFCVSAILAPFA